MQHPHCSHCTCLRAKAVWASLWRFYTSVRYKLTCLFLQLFSALLTRPKSLDLRPFTSRARRSNPTAPKQNGAKHLLQALLPPLPQPGRGAQQKPPGAGGLCWGPGRPRAARWQASTAQRHPRRGSRAGGFGPSGGCPPGAVLQEEGVCGVQRVFVESLPSLCLCSPKYLLGVPVAARGSVSHNNQHLLIW